MILLDTHIWIWWIDGNQRLTNQLRQYLQEHEVDKWLEQALNYPSIYLLPLTLPVILDAIQLPQPFFHRDPAEQLMVATGYFIDVPNQIFGILDLIFTECEKQLYEQP